MEKEIQDRFNEAVLAEVRQRYGLAADQIEMLDGFESFIFEFQKNGRAYILRIGHSRRRSPEMIQGEVDWINYLAAGGAAVARAVLSQQGHLVEVVPDGQGGQFLATAFVKAPGGPPHQMGLWHEPLFVPYGRLLGRMHKLSKTYQPQNPAWQRPSWDDETMQYGHLYLAAEQTAVHDRYQKLMAQLQSLPVESDGYGMIHQDAHAGNFFVDENYQITLFDFDDCVYGHFAYDIAMVMFYAITNHPQPEDMLAKLWRPFMQGYLAENKLDEKWFETIPAFMKLREIDLYAVLMDTFGAEPMGDQWIDTFMKGRRELILEKPYVNFDFQLD